VTYQDTTDETNLESSWYYMKYHACEQETYTLGSSIYRSREPASLSGQMEIEIKAKQMCVNASGNFSNSLLGNRGKNCIAQFLENCRSYSCQAIYVTSVSIEAQDTSLHIIHATTMLPATVHAVPPIAIKSTFMLSTIDLK
jgi:hypothetical protein